MKTRTEFFVALYCATILGLFDGLTSGNVVPVMIAGPVGILALFLDARRK